MINREICNSDCYFPQKGELVITQDDSLIILSDGIHNTSVNYFSGVVLYSKNKNLKIGDHRSFNAKGVCKITNKIYIDGVS